MTTKAEALARSRQTVRSYEGYAREYDEVCGVELTPPVEESLRQLLDATVRGAKMLEIGSGPGREADFVEAHGASVRRTDATQAFLDLQAERGKQGELLDLLTDELGGPYDAVFALCVLIHIDRGETDRVLKKIGAALRPGGVFLVSLREGDGESIGEYHTVYWQREEFLARLDTAGFELVWEQHSVGRDGDAWLHFLARRA